jgi:hypothetical protein
MQKMQTLVHHRFGLDGSSREAKKKINCPSCGSRRAFTRYKDYETGLFIDDSVGMCDRANKCGYHLRPKEWFALHPNEKMAFKDHYRPLQPEVKQLVHIPFTVLKSTLKDYENNSFIKALLNFFSVAKIEKAISEYYIGTAKSITGDNNKSVCFWFIDRNNNIRAGQVKQFDADCKTIAINIGEEVIKAFWIHKVLKRQYQITGQEVPQWLSNYEGTEKITCLFGEHLLNKYPSKHVALVEAPKSAVIASMMWPDYVWLATSSLTYLTKDRCKALKGRKVVLFPDTGICNKRTGKTCLMEWQERVKEFEHLAQFAFSTLLEEKTTLEQKASGFDVADLVLSELKRTPLQISSKDFSYTGETKTGKDFNNMVVASVWDMQANKKYRILFAQDGSYVTLREVAEPLSQFFELDFVPAMIDDKSCLINIEKN